jgi:hypothetical protein
MLLIAKIEQIQLFRRSTIRNFRIVISTWNTISSVSVSFALSWFQKQHKQNPKFRNAFQKEQAMIHQ